MECMKPKKSEKEAVAPVKALPDAILAALYEKMDLLDKEITAKEEEYKQIVNFIKTYNR
jgi:TRAP-type mannitol/chloroaromatic compound transport system substrate-binding protein